jgi:hypothetical protein
MTRYDAFHAACGGTVDFRAHLFTLLFKMRMAKVKEGTKGKAVP